MSFTDVLLMMFTAVLVENFIFSRFYGCCPFLGVSEKPDTALGMGMAVTFVMTVSGAATWAVYRFLLVPFGLEYLKTVAFILVIAALVQFIEMFLRRFIPALYGALGIYLPLITTNCADCSKGRGAVLGASDCAERVQFPAGGGVRFLCGARFHACHHGICGTPRADGAR